MKYSQFLLLYKDLFFENPLKASYYGLKEKDSLLPDLSSGYNYHHYHKAKALLVMLETEKEQEEEHKLELIYLRRLLKKELFKHEQKSNGLHTWEQKPELAHSILLAFLPLLMRYEEQDTKFFKKIEQRLLLLPKMIQSYKGVLKGINTSYYEQELQDLEEVKKLFKVLLTIAQEKESEELRSMKESLLLTCEELNSYIDELHSLEGLPIPHLSEEELKEFLGLRGLEMNNKQLFFQIKKQYEKKAQELEELSNELKKKYKLNKHSSQSDLLHFVRNLFTLENRDLLDYYKEEQKRIHRFLFENDSFPFPQKYNCTIETTPSYLKPFISGQVLFPPAPYDPLSKKSIFYVSQDDLEENNALELTRKLLKEESPGIHLLFASHYESNNELSKLNEEPSFCMAWSHYVEHFVAKQGYLDSEHEQEYRLLSLSEELTILVQAVLDLYLLTGDLRYLLLKDNFFPRASTVQKKAELLLEEVTGHSKEQVKAQIAYQLKEQGLYLLNFCSLLALDELKKKVMKGKRGEEKKKALKAFHTTLLRKGPCPFDILTEECIQKGLIERNENQTQK
jgi:hypothetical protein